MALVIGADSALSVAANTKTANQISGDYEFIGQGTVTLACKASATGLNVSYSVGGVSLVNDQPIPFTGTAGTLDVSANVMVNQRVGAGRNELSFRNTTGGALTVDYVLDYTR